MRRVALGCLLVTTGVAIVGSATAVSTRAPEQFNQTLTLAGGLEASSAASTAAYVDDPDAPIATARYGGERSRPQTIQTSAFESGAVETYATPATATIALAGGPAERVPASPPAHLIVAEQATPAPAPAKTETVRPAARILAEAPAPRRAPVLGLTRVHEIRPYGKVLKVEINDQPLPFTPLGLQSSAVKRLTLQASNIMSKTRASAEDLRRGRWMLFAASSGKAYGLNLIRDTIDGWRNAGYSEERVARFGSRQVGLGWRKDNRQVSLTATRRKLTSIDYSDKDTVVGVTVSVRGK